MTLPFSFNLRASCVLLPRRDTHWASAVPHPHLKSLPPGLRCSALPVAEEAEHKRVQRSVGNAAASAARRPQGTANGHGGAKRRMRKAGANPIGRKSVRPIPRPVGMATGHPLTHPHPVGTGLPDGHPFLSAPSPCFDEGTQHQGESAHRRGLHLPSARHPPP